MSSDEVSFWVIGLNVFGSLKLAMTRRPPRTPGSHFATNGGSGSGNPPAGPGPDAAPSPELFLQPADRPRTTAATTQDLIRILMGQVHNTAPWPGEAKRRTRNARRRFDARNADLPSAVS